MRLDGLAVQGAGLGLSVQQRQCSDINMSSSNWRDGEICEWLTIMGDEVMQSHLTKMERWYDPRESIRGTSSTRLLL